MPRQCIFCGDLANSGEHVWPDWLNEVLGAYVVDGDTTSNWMQQSFGELPIDRRFPRHQLADLTTNALCHDCNVVRLSVLERRVKKILTPMIYGRSTKLSPREAYLLARWVVKTAMVVQTTFEEDMTFTEAECHFLMDKERPPPSVRVVVGAIDRAPTHLCYGEIEHPIEPMDTDSLQFMTLLVGPVIFQIVRKSPPPSDYRAAEQFAIPRQLDFIPGITIPLFLASGTGRWPPPGILQPEALNLFVKRSHDTPPEWAIPDRYDGPVARTAPRPKKKKKPKPGKNERARRRAESE